MEIIKRAEEIGFIPKDITGKWDYVATLEKHPNQIPHRWTLWIRHEGLMVSWVLKTSAVVSSKPKARYKETILELSDDKGNEKFCFNSWKEPVAHPEKLMKLLDQLEKVEDTMELQQQRGEKENAKVGIHSEAESAL